MKRPFSCRAGMEKICCASSSSLTVMPFCSASIIPTCSSIICDRICWSTPSCRSNWSLRLPPNLVVEAAAELLAIRLNLREVAVLKIAGADGAAVDLGHHFPRSGTGAGRSGLDEIWNVEEHEGQHHDCEAP